MRGGMVAGGVALIVVGFMLFLWISETRAEYQTLSGRFARAMSSDAVLEYELVQLIHFGGMVMMLVGFVLAVAGGVMSPPKTEEKDSSGV